MSQIGYKQFCPVAMAAEILCSRWTLVLMRELIAGSSRFNELRRGVPKMSPSLLSQRLRELELAGIVTRKPSRTEKGSYEYALTPAGRDVRQIVEAMGFWGQKWVDSEQSLQNTDPTLLMWDMRRNLNPEPLPKRRVTIEFTYPEQPSSKRRWWLVIEPDGEVDLCWADPGFPVDLHVSSSLRSMTAVWMGLTTVAREKNNIRIEGDREVARSMQTWLGLSPFAVQKKLVG